MTFCGVTLDKETAEQFKEFLREKDIYFEPSECGKFTYIAFQTDLGSDYVMRWFSIWQEAKSGNPVK